MKLTQTHGALSNKNRGNTAIAITKLASNNIVISSAFFLVILSSILSSRNSCLGSIGARTSRRVDGILFQGRSEVVAFRNRGIASIIAPRNPSWSNFATAPGTNCRYKIYTDKSFGRSVMSANTGCNNQFVDLTNDGGDDEEFLANFDVDAAVAADAAQRGSSSTSSTDAAYQNLSKSSVNPYKRSGASLTRNPYHSPKSSVREMTGFGSAAKGTASPVSGASSSYPYGAAASPNSATRGANPYNCHHHSPSRNSFPNVVTTPPSPKRIKTFSPSTSMGRAAADTALHASSSTSSMQTGEEENYNRGMNNSPFRPSSKFSVGNEVNHNEYDIPLSTFNVNSSSSSYNPTNEIMKSANQMPTGVNNVISFSDELPKVSSSTWDKMDNTFDTPNDDETMALKQTLIKHFGYNTYRPGQLSAIQALMSKRDVAVFWATGSGKSLCYQIPPLHSTNHHKIGIVVSPLISLMQDQVSKLNGMMGSTTSVAAAATNNADNNNEDVAAYLGSGQFDPTVEERALRGEYKLVYLTPEKLLSGKFLDALARLHTQHGRAGAGGEGKICLIAIDESHCVSEWGHDFRPEYRAVGDMIRSHPVLQSIPLLALTATAVPRVQRDIVQNLRMRDPFIVRQSFDRTNLDIVVRKKDRNGGGYCAALKPIVEEFKTKKNTNGSVMKMGGMSTIIYAPTRDLVDEITTYLQLELRDVGVNVEAYHAGLTQDARTLAHTNFLIGKTAVIVATIAFGMGIDKPDTRRVIHYGPPKTLEEYYQQIGRAGRDGLRAECVMYVSENDFDKYKSDFYLGGLKGEAKEATIRSIDALRQYALDSVTCRRRKLLSFFHEIPKFGERCGTCDTCLNIKRYGDDNERDFARLGARVVLKAVESLDWPSMSILEKVVLGNTVEHYRYNKYVRPELVKEQIMEERKRMGKSRPLAYFRELISPLVTKGYLEQGAKSAVHGGFTRSWTTYKLSSLGHSVLSDEEAVIMLPVPESLRESERAEEEKRQRVLSQLKEAGVDVDKIPKEEVETGDGEVITALRKYHGYIDSLARQGRTERVEQLEDLRYRIEAWRSDVAAQYRMAPAAVMPEHIVVSLAYSASSLKPGMKMEKEALVMAGVRTRGLDALVNAIGEWVDDVQPKVNEESATVCSPMVFDTEVFKPQSSWEYAVYKPMKKTGMASWESSHQRFMNGEHPQTIAISPANGRPIQINTVVGHILDGLTHGRAVSLRRLAEVSTPPNKEQWEELHRAEIDTGMDVTRDPSTSGKNGDKFTMTEFLRPIMGEERNERDKAKFSEWCGLLSWYMALRRAGYTPRFAES